MSAKAAFTRKSEDETRESYRIMPFGNLNSIFFHVARKTGTKHTLHFAPHVSFHALFLELSAPFLLHHIKTVFTDTSVQQLKQPFGTRRKLAFWPCHKCLCQSVLIPSFVPVSHQRHSLYRRHFIRESVLFRLFLGEGIQS